MHISHTGQSIGQACLSWQLLLHPCKKQQLTVISPRSAVLGFAGHLTSTALHSTRPEWPCKHMEVRAQKIGASPVPQTASLCKVRGHFLSLCQSNSRIRWGCCRQRQGQRGSWRCSHQRPPHLHGQHVPFTVTLLEAWGWISPSI